jgi:hypothetical protein
MIVAYQIVLLVIILLSFLYALVEKKDQTFRIQLIIICIAGMVSYIASVNWLG